MSTIIFEADTIELSLLQTILSTLARHGVIYITPSNQPIVRKLAARIGEAATVTVKREQQGTEAEGN